MAYTRTPLVFADSPFKIDLPLKTCGASPAAPQVQAPPPSQADHKQEQGGHWKGQQGGFLSSLQEFKF